MSTLASLENALHVSGYRPGPGEVPAAVVNIDREVCQQLECDCGHQGMTFRPFRQGRSYRGLAVCPSCNATVAV